MTTSVVQLVPSSPLRDEDALGELQRLSPPEIKETRLAERWGWPRARVRQRIKQWRRAGLVAQATNRRGRPSKRAAETSRTIARPEPEAETATQPTTFAPAPPDAKADPGPATVPSFPRNGPDNVARHHHDLTSRRFIAAVLGVAAVLLAAVGLFVNARYTASFGRSNDAGLFLALLGLVIEIVVIVLPTAASQLWESRNRLSAIGAWILWLPCLAIMLIAACGFAATNIGDSLQGRASTVDARTLLIERLERMRSERNAIAETRPASAIEAEMQLAQAGADSVWRSTKGCTDISKEASGVACGAVLILRAAKAEAERRDALEGQIAAAEVTLDSLPAISTSDPGARMAADLIGWLTRGELIVTEEDVQRMRIAGLTIAPAMSGLLLSLVTMLWRRPRCEKGIIAS
jgi:hypothetical protein